MGGEAFGEMDLSRLTPVWQLIDQAELEMTRADEFHSLAGATLTARRFDESQPAGLRTYIVSHQLISTALDHHRALQNLLTHGVTVSAPWTLLRSVFEGSFWVHWILQSNDGAERHRRGLRRACLDQKEQQRWLDVFARLTRPQAELIATGRAEVTGIYRAEADQLRLPWSQVYNKINMVDELPQLEVARAVFGQQAWLLEGVWRAMSGHAHGFGYAVQSSSSIERSVKVPGGQRIVFTINEDSFISQAMVTGYLLLTAMNLHIDRSTTAVTR